MTTRSFQRKEQAPVDRDHSRARWRPKGDSNRSAPAAARVGRREAAGSPRGDADWRREAAALEAAFEAVADGVIVYNSQGAIVRINAAALALVGAEADPRYAHLPLEQRLERIDLRGAEGAALGRDQWPHSRILRGETLGGAGTEDIRIRSLDGRLLELSVSGAPIRDGHGHITGAVAVYRDVTTSRRLERHINEFVSMVSHELRNPLTSIRGSIQLAERRLRKAAEAGRSVADVLPMALEPLERGERQTGLLDRLVGDLLDVSRIQTGRLDLRFERADLASLVRETTAQQRLRNPRRIIALELADAAVPVTVDPDRIIQVVSNYLSNALKYSPDDSSVEVRLALEPGTARVSVRDEGPGIPIDQQATIWDRFQRTPGAAASEKDGLGLGLFISRTLIERHGGQVGVDSAPGRGATFWFTLPLLPS